MHIREISKELYDEIMAQKLYGWIPIDMRWKFGLNDSKYFGCFVENFGGKYFVRYYSDDA